MTHACDREPAAPQKGGGAHCVACRAARIAKPPPVKCPRPTTSRSGKIGGKMWRTILGGLLERILTLPPMPTKMI